MRANTRYIALFWLVLAVLWFANIGHNALIKPDEGRYATLSLNILLSGDWVTPRLNGLLYFEKPVLQYCLGAISFILFGFNEFAARLWPAVAGWATVLLIGLTGRALWGSRAGHFSAMILASCVWFFANSHFVNLDTGLTFFLTGALCAFLLAQRAGLSANQCRRYMHLCWAAMALATLSKGLIGVLIPAAVLVLYSFLLRQWALWGKVALFSGAVIYLLLTAPWFIAVSLKNPDFAHFFFVHEHFQRFLTTQHRRPGPIWFFIPCLLLGFMPWLSLLPGVMTQAIRSVVVKTSERQEVAILLIWVLFVFVFFSLSGSKLPSYILPLFPALALLAGRYMAHTTLDEFKNHLWLPLFVWLGALGVLPFVPHWVRPDVPSAIVAVLLSHIFWAAVVSIIAIMVSRFFLTSGRLFPAMATLTFASLLALTLIVVGYNPYGEKFRSSKTLVADLHPWFKQASDIYAVNGYDQTLPFYLQRNVTLVDYVDEFALGEQLEPHRWIATLENFVPHWQANVRPLAFMSLTAFERLQKKHLPMRVIAQTDDYMVVVKP